MSFKAGHITQTRRSEHGRTNFLELYRPDMRLIIGELVESLFAHSLDPQITDMNSQGVFSLLIFLFLCLEAIVNELEKLTCRASQFWSKVYK